MFYSYNVIPSKASRITLITSQKFSLNYPKINLFIKLLRSYSLKVICHIKFANMCQKTLIIEFLLKLVSDCSRLPFYPTTGQILMEVSCFK